jgi:hypothetical protein
MHLEVKILFKVHLYLNRNAQWMRKCNAYLLEFIQNNTVQLEEIIC